MKGPRTSQQADGHEGPGPIRLAREHDVNAIRRIAEHAYALYVPRMGKKPAPMVADFDAAIADEAIYCLQRDDQIAGYIHCYRRGDTFFIENVAVHPDLQGTGAGRLMMGFAEDSARQQGLETITLYTNKMMVENIAWYQALSYEIVEEKYENGFNRVYFLKTL